MTYVDSSLADLRFKGQLVTDATDMSPYLVDWRRRYFGNALAVALPETTQAVCEVLRWAYQTGTPVFTQGGNTGLSGGATPDSSGRALVLSTRRLNRIRSLDVESNVLVAEAGVVLANVQKAAAEQERLFPLSLAAEGSCTVGGVLATNAGGTQALRYGTARDLCLGMEVAMADGSIWNGLKSLRKDNTGLSLKDLFVGSEGALGVVCAASVKLFPRPTKHLTSFLALPSYRAALTVLRKAEDCFGPGVTAFEVLDQACVRAVLDRNPAMRAPIDAASPLFALIELSCFGALNPSEEFSDFLGSVLDEELANDAVLATSLEHREKMWELREGGSEAVASWGPQFKHDISVPICSIAKWVEEAEARLAQFPNLRLAVFGHLGDGNLHYNVSAATGLSSSELELLQSNVNKVVHDLVDSYGGSISAEHGLGQLRNDEAARYRAPAANTLLFEMKRIFDPRGILNPGRYLPSAS